MSNEKQTRKEIIDNRLKQAGWNIDDRTQVIEEFFITKENNVVNEPTTTYNSEFSDYVLTIGVEQFQGAAHPHQARQEITASAIRAEANLVVGHHKFAVLGGIQQIAAQGQRHATARSHAIDGADEWLLHIDPM